MSSPILHIKDAYYFEVPHVLWKSNRETIEDFPDHYVRLDPDYQDWEAHRQYEGLADTAGLQNLPAEATLLEEYHHWRHDHAHYASPFDRFLEEGASQTWFQRQLGLGKFAARQRGETETDYSARMERSASLGEAWDGVKANAEDLTLYKSELREEEPAGWSAEKIETYNRQLDGKIFIPQIFGGKLRNNYERESGFAISKFMVLELVVAVLLVVVFKALSTRMKDGRVPKGRRWNLFETFLLFIRDGIAKPAIGGHDADRFVPLLWTMFMFVLACNLLGMLPWLGAPTASFSVTIALALVTFGTGVVFGLIKFGPIGYLKNQIPHMDLPWYMAIIIKPMIFFLEVLGLLIKHVVLGFRLLANMVAGHMVLLAIMGLAVAAAASTIFPYVAVASVVGSTILSFLELFVAFLQAYVFTFLSALFIGAAVHHH
jgi:F-type H+-transporting ATPase subunit a